MTVLLFENLWYENAATRGFSATAELIVQSNTVVQLKFQHVYLEFM